MNNNVSCLQVLLIFACFCLIMCIIGFSQGDMSGAVVAIAFVFVAIVVIAILAIANHLKS